MHNHFLYSLLIGSALLVGCSAQPPKEFTEIDKKATTYPDFSNTTIPYNIAPLNFDYQMEGKQYITELKAEEQTLIMKGKQTDWKVKQWHNLLEANKGKKIEVITYVQTDKGWERYRPTAWLIANEPIDPYISYRIIAPHTSPTKSSRYANATSRTSTSRSSTTTCCKATM